MLPWPTPSRALPCAEQDRLEKSSRPVQGTLFIADEKGDAGQQLLFDQLGGHTEQREGQREPEHLGCGQVDRQLEPGRKLDR